MHPPAAPAATPPPTAAQGIRTGTLESADGTVDVDVEAGDSAVLGDVLPVLAACLGLVVGRLWTGSAPLPTGTPLTAVELCQGAVLGLDRSAPRPRGPSDGAGEAAPGALELQVVGGPDAGRVLPLAAGSLVVGRGAGCGFALTDPDVSRRHVLVHVGSGQVTVADLGSSNGSVLRTPTGTVDLPAQPTAWSVGATVVIGSSSVRLSGFSGLPLDAAPAAAGRMRVRPVPSAPIRDEEVLLPEPAAPAEVGRRRLGWVALAVPAVGGVLMAWLLSAPQFLFFAVLGPLAAVCSWASDRLSGRRHHRRSTADHAAALARFRADLDSAVAAAVGRREAGCPDPAQLVTAVRRRSAPLWSRTGGGADLLVVRVGTGRGPAGVTRVAADGTRTPVAADLPVTVDLATGDLGVVGPRARITGVARALVSQLATLTSPGDLRILVLTTSGHLAGWRWTRWLPAVRTLVLAGEEAEPQADPEGREVVDGLLDPAARTLVVLDAPIGARTAAALARAPHTVRVALAASETSLPAPVTRWLTVGGETGLSGRLGETGTTPDREITLDAVPEPVAAAAARALAALTPPAGTGGLPTTVPLVDLPTGGLQLGPVTGQVTGQWDRGRRALTTPLGCTERGPLALDLCAQGPHALIAGTTGSGKSELLQTLVAGLALHHPPDRVSFLLVDYKGGAAFAEAARLPHTVGMLTDLDPQSTVRALRSLTAELTRRERLLAEHGVRDVADLPPAVALARLVIVVDEFATLADELPGFVTGLVGIAQRGRSLGVHLVLATQRPSGVVSPEIRANCSLRISLRTTDEGDSRDVLGTPQAAALPAGRPGRAYLRAGSAAPVLLQVARASAASARGRTGVRVQRSSWPAARVDREPGPAGPGQLAVLVDALGRWAQDEDLVLPGRPWLPPLLGRLPVEALDQGLGEHPMTDGVPAAPPPTRLSVGLLDFPDTQCQSPLVLDLAEGGGWLLVGGPRSGRTTALRTVLGEAVHQLGPEGLHVHVLDHGGGTLAAEAARWPHAGTTVGRDDAHRAVRLIARLQAEVDRRRAGALDATPVLLLVDGYESLAAQLDDADPDTGSPALVRLVREGAAAGLTCVVTADRAVPGGRLAAAAHERLVLPLPDRTDYAVAGIGPRAVPADRPPGRALLGEDAVECQLALPRSGLSPRRGVSGHGSAAAIRVVTLPPDPELFLPARLPPGTDRPWWLPIGPGDDDGRPVGVDLARGGRLLVVGGPGSGRSSALAAFARHCLAAGAAVLALADPSAVPLSPESEEPWCPPPAGAQAGRGGRPGHGAGPAPAEHCARDDPAGLRAWAARAAGGPAVVVADDVGRLPDAVADVLAELAGRVPVLAAASATEVAGAFRGPTVALRRTRTALLLRPAAGDAELLGLRVPRTPLPPRPGAGWLVEGAAVTRVQVARRRQGPGTGGRG